MNKNDLNNLDFVSIKGYEDLQILARQNTTDLSCLKEVLEQKCYKSIRHDFDVKRNEKWLDLGGNIGAFGLYVMKIGGTIVSYEPDNYCYDIMEMNYQNNFKFGYEIINTSISEFEENKLTFYKGGKDTDRYRTSLIPNTKDKIELNNTYAGLISNQKFDGIKMDIEGAEFGLIDNNLLPKSNKLVMEYHLTKDRSMINFQKRMNLLREIYDQVLYMPSLDRGYPDDKYPGFFDRIIICKNDE